jgi:putative restriction endonuclease
MRYWWVNQNQTFKHEFEGGYLWSPKRKANGAINPFYEFMREVSPGDFIFSFEGARIRAIGLAQSNAYGSPKPAEFGNAGPNWDSIGWRINVQFVLLDHSIKPSEHMEQILPVLPPKYSALQETGRGNQNVYLTFVPPMMADVLTKLIGEEAWLLRNMLNRVAANDASDTAISLAAGQEEWEEHLMQNLRDDTSLSETERECLVMARRGQGVFKQNVLKLERSCRITKVDRIEHLRASHIKPWRDCYSSERLGAENGLLLTPSIDHLFDQGFISFEDNGVLLISRAAHLESLQRMGVETERKLHVGSFSNAQKSFLDFHRDSVFLKAKISL